MPDISHTTRWKKKLLVLYELLLKGVYGKKYIVFAFIKYSSPNLFPYLCLSLRNEKKKYVKVALLALLGPHLMGPQAPWVWGREGRAPRPPLFRHPCLCFSVRLIERLRSTRASKSRLETVRIADSIGDTALAILISLLTLVSRLLGTHTHK